jgi:oligoribonuclease NrnB/cAMP/cGMP phosphodiesterase (DHH superfamily)
LDKRVHNYRKEKLKKMRRALKGHCDQIVHDRVVRVIEIPNGVTTTDLGTFLADEKNLQINGETLQVADMLISVSQGGMLGFRRGRENVLCDAAAKIFNGGGHPYAAGGEYGVYDDFQAVCDDIIVTLQKDKSWVL